MISMFKKYCIKCYLLGVSRIYSTAIGKRWFLDHIPYWGDMLAQLSSDKIKHQKNPYSNSMCAKEQAADRKQSAIFVTGRFRSGSTLLWNIFRDVPGMTSFYEPFNERQWFDASARGEHTDNSHLGVDDYWREYEGVDGLSQCYKESWVDQRLYMNERSVDLSMLKFVDRLIDGSVARPILQFNRIDFRLGWFKAYYPKAKIVHLYRHPRDQWLSVVKNNQRCPVDQDFTGLGSQDFFYLRRWGRDLCNLFPFLREEDLDHPYQQFYLLWRLSYDFGMKYADHSLSYENLLENPVNALTELFKAVSIDEACVAKASKKVERLAVGKWHQYADDGWFLTHEKICDEILEEFYRGAR